MKKAINNFLTTPTEKNLNIMVHELNPFIFYICKTVLKRADLAEDATQETLMKIIQKSEYLEPSDHIIGWVQRTAYLTSLAILKKENTRKKIESQFTKDEQTNECDLLASEQIHKLINREVESLPEKYKVPIELKFQKNMKYKQIGKLLNISSENARKKVDRGILRLRKKLSKLMAPIALMLSLSYAIKKTNSLLTTFLLKTKQIINTKNMIKTSGSFKLTVSTIISCVAFINLYHFYHGHSQVTATNHNQEITTSVPSEKTALKMSPAERLLKKKKMKTPDIFGNWELDKVLGKKTVLTNMKINSDGSYDMSTSQNNTLSGNYKVNKHLIDFSKLGKYSFIIKEGQLSFFNANGLHSTWLKKKAL